MTVTEPSLDFSELDANAAEIRRADKDVEKLIARRNALWRKFVKAGAAPADVGAPYRLQAQTVRLAIKQMDAGTKPKARNARYRGLKAGGNKAAK